MTDVTQTLWGYCHTLRHDGMDYGDYIEQLTYLLFLKMAEERGNLDLSQCPDLPDNPHRTYPCDWKTLLNKSSSEIVSHYTRVLAVLSHQNGILGDIFYAGQSRFTNAASLKKLLGFIEAIKWTSLPVDVKGEAFEGLLERAASEGKKGAGQYFTPRPLIRAIVECLKPDAVKEKNLTICDPACGTGGYLVAAYEWLWHKYNRNLPAKDTSRIRTHTYFGQELVARPRRLALMNLYLHGVEPHITLGDSIYEQPHETAHYRMILTNPPFGTKGANQVPERNDFTVRTANKQLNFLQHILTILEEGGRAGIVVPDNVLFADQAGEIFEVLMQHCNLHTVWRLPRGTFTPYSPGTKTYVIFFQKGLKTERVWLYDGRANVPMFTKKERKLTDSTFSEYLQCFGNDPNGCSLRNESDSPEGRWRAFGIDDVRARGYKLDSFKWLKDTSTNDDLPKPEELITDAIGQLTSAIEKLNLLLLMLENNNPPSSAKSQSAGIAA